METALKILLTFILTGVFGNWLLQRWQTRSWFLQQRFLGQEKEYSALKELADEIATLAATRIFYTGRLISALRLEDKEKLRERLNEYDAALKRWNERLTSFYVRLPLFADFDLATRLEESLHNRMAAIGRKAEDCTRLSLAGGHAQKGTLCALDKELLQLQGRTIDFNKRLLRVVRSRRADVYFGAPISFSENTLPRFSTWQLIKAFFIRDIDAFSIVRAPMDS